MAEANEAIADSATSQADVLALAEEAEAEAAEAEALAAAARARARAARLRREAQALAKTPEKEAAKTTEDTETTEATEVIESTEAVEAAETVEAPVTDEAETVEAPIPAETETVEAPKPQSPTRPRRWLRMPTLPTIAKVAAILLVIGFTGFSGFVAWKHHQSTQRQHRIAAFAAGARQGVINMTSMDYKRAKDDVQRLIDSSTGQFRDDFQQRANDFVKVVQDSQVVTEGAVNAAAVESMDDHSAQVLVSATERITNSAGAKDEPRPWRFRVTVTEEDGQYKMSKIEFVP